MKLNMRQQQIVNILLLTPRRGISFIKDQLKQDISIPTINRDLKMLVNGGVLTKHGSGPAITYTVQAHYLLLHETQGDSYFNIEIDERQGNKKFDPSIFNLLANTELFTAEEAASLENIQKLYTQKIQFLSPTILQKEKERLTIELSWKSSQIEGNTYTLLETELLLKDKQEAPDKEKAEAIMLLNHKIAMDYLHEERIPLQPLQVRAIEDIHSLLTTGLGISKNLRSRMVGITGTSYKPPDNEYQIREYLEMACTVINNKKNIYEKAMLAIMLISVLQPFEDGNKRTGRITGNGILMGNNYCPLSFRSVTAIDYKKAMIFFYEQFNVAAFKKIFIEQARFAVETYF